MDFDYINQVKSLHAKENQKLETHMKYLHHLFDTEILQ